MALPSPVAAFPDMSALVQQSQARSQSMINSAWMTLKQGSNEQAAKAAQIQAIDEATRRAEQYQPYAGRGYADAIQNWTRPDRSRPAGSSGGMGSPAASSPNDQNFPVTYTGAMAPFLPLLDKHEGGGRYDTLFGHAQREGGRFAGVDVSRMTLGQLRQFTDVNGEYGQWVKNKLAEAGQEARVATPMGRHQIVGTTLFNAAKALNLSDDTVFSAEVQDNIAAHLARQRLASADSMAGKIAGLRAEWEGFKHVDDEALAKAIQQFEASA